MKLLEKESKMKLTTMISSAARLRILKTGC